MKMKLDTVTSHNFWLFFKRPHLISTDKMKWLPKNEYVGELHGVGRITFATKQRQTEATLKPVNDESFSFIHASFLNSLNCLRTLTIELRLKNKH